MLPADLDEGADRLSQARGEEMVPEYAGGPRVSHDVRIPLMQVIAREWPVIQCGPCVMILNEGDCSGRPHAQQARRPPLAVHQPPVLPPAHGLLQDPCSTTSFLRHPNTPSLS